MRKTLFAVLTVTALTAPAFAIPSGWGKLSLSPTQKTQLDKVSKSYRDQIKTLNDQIQALKDKQRAEELAVLTAEQRKQLAASITGETPPAPAPQPATAQAPAK